MLTASCAATPEGAGPPDAARLPDAMVSIDAPLPDAPLPDARLPDATVAPDARPDASSGDSCSVIVEKCNGEDDNCNGQEDETFEDLGDPCVSGMGICAQSGLVMCTDDGLGTRCSATPKPSGSELCANGLDDDCDGTADEGFDNLGTLCTSGMGACKASGAWICSPDKKSLVCSGMAGTPGPDELCGNAIDDDCDGATDEGFEMFGTGCMAGVGGCARPGFWVCSPDKKTLLCNAIPGPAGPAELCGNAIDDDCDNETDEGFGDVGFPCDSPNDADLCPEGMYVCSVDKLSVVCNDNTGNTPDLCDNVDNDCNPGTPDGADETVIKIPTACDSLNDNDSCNEGIYACASGSITCTDPANDDTSNDAQNCGGCGLPCETTHTNSVSCQGFGCVPVCSFPYQSCDNNPRNGCESTRDTAATCFDPVDLGDQNGDDNTSGVTRTGFGEAAFKVRMLEDNWTDENANGIVTITNPSDATFTLCVYCDSCQKTSPNNPSGPPYKCVTPNAGMSGSVQLGRADELGDDHVPLYIEIKYSSGNSINASCGNWSMNVHASDSSSDCTCDPDHTSGGNCD